MNEIISPGSLRRIHAQKRAAIAKQVRTRYRPLLEAAGTRDAKMRLREAMKAEIAEHVVAYTLDPKYTPHCV